MGSGEGMTVKYSEILEQRQQRATTRRKGERTRDRLKLAAVRLLDDNGYRDMRVSDICDHAGVSVATFYIYYTNKTDITTEVLTEFLRTIFDIAEEDGPYRSSFEAIYKANLGWLATVRANAGLLRCLLQLSDETPEFAELSQEANHQWYQRVAARIGRLTDGYEPISLLAAYSLGSMIDELCRRLFVAADPHLVELVKRVAPTDEALAEFMAVIWYRAVYATNPDGVASPAATDLIALAKALERPQAGARGAPKAG